MSAPLPARLAIAAPDVAHQDMDGEVVLVHLGRGTFHGLRGSAAAIFTDLLRDGRPEAILAAARARFVGEDAAIEAGVRDLLGRLLAEGLVRATTEDGAPDAAGALSRGPSARVPFEAPVLESHADLQDLLLLDPIHEVEPEGWPRRAEGAR